MDSETCGNLHEGRFFAQMYWHCSQKSCQLRWDIYVSVGSNEIIVREALTVKPATMYECHYRQTRVTRRHPSRTYYVDSQTILRAWYFLRTVEQKNDHRLASTNCGRLEAWDTELARIERGHIKGEFADGWLKS